MMDSATKHLLDELYAEGQHNDEQQSQYSKRMMNLQPETAQFMSILVRSSHRQHVLEIGTSNGYSTTWLAWSVRATGGHLTSIDRDARKHILADANLQRAGLREFVDLVSGDATALVRDLPGPFDCVFFDADRYSAPVQLEALLPKLSPEVLLLADNALSHPSEIVGYLTSLANLPDFDHMILPIGKGLSIAYRGLSL
jgi:predicted O-methyltransferase YrrM